MGFCGSNYQMGYGRGGFGRGFFGRGRGRGFGWFSGFNRSFPNQLPAPEKEADYLRQEARDLETYLEEIKTRLAALEEKTVPDKAK
jgi:hypothetical protein